MDADYRLPPLKGLAVFVVSLIVFVVLDVFWISVVAGSFYQDQLGPLLKPQPGALAALLSWVCIVAGNQLFVLPRTAGFRNLFVAASQGALYGLVLYGTVDLTNCALLKHWGWSVALVDMAWGSLASAVLATLQNRLHAALM